MRKMLVLSVVIAAFLASPAYALFTNGGFETGTDAGWTITGDHSVVSSFTNQWIPPGWPSGVPYYGSYSLLLGSGDVGNVWDADHSSNAFQQDTVKQADIDSGLHLYFKWGAILEEPTNGVFHSAADQAYFSINVLVNGTSIYYADHRADQSGFTKIGTATNQGDSGDIWSGTGIGDIDLAGAALGDVIAVSLYVRDCGLGGHGGLVFLDGFGTTRPPDAVPEPSTMLLLGSGLVSLVGYGRKRLKK